MAKYFTTEVSPLLEVHLLSLFRLVAFFAALLALGAILRVFNSRCLENLDCFENIRIIWEVILLGVDADESAQHI